MYGCRGLYDLTKPTREGPKIAGRFTFDDGSTFLLMMGYLFIQYIHIFLLSTLNCSPFMIEGHNIPH